MENTSIFILLSIFCGFLLLRRWLAGGYCREVYDLTGKTIIITGANAGIGLETAKILAKMGKPQIILACRDIQKARSAENEIKKTSLEIKILRLCNLIWLIYLQSENFLRIILIEIFLWIF